MTKNFTFSPDIRKVAPENLCDVCQSKYAPFYSVLYYIHVCSLTCYQEFIQKFNEEMTNIAITRYRPSIEDPSNEEKK